MADRPVLQAAPVGVGLCLAITCDGRAAGTYSLPSGYCLIGRSRVATLRLDHPGISRRHCVVHAGGEYVTVQDLSSRNGSALNGRPLPPLEAVRLVPGDEIQLGAIRIQLGISHDPNLASLPALIRPDGRRDERDARARPSVRERPAVSLDLARLAKSEIVLGRAPDCDIQVDHPGVSRYHARLRHRRSGWLIEDLGSAHGTFLDGERLVRPTALQDGQQIEIVGQKFTLSGGTLARHVTSGVQRIEAVRLGRRVRGGKAILRDVYLEAEAGELVALVGATGSGKTTLLNALCGFAPATHGTVLFDRLSLYTHYDLFRAQIGYVPQQDILHESLPLERALSYAADLRLPDRPGAGSHTHRVNEVMAQLGIAGARQQAISTLSGGERKRANIAAELIAAPSVLFLDEPAAALDAEVEAALMVQLRELADSGKIVMVVTHVTQNIMLCDKVAFLAPGGYLAYYGRPEEALDYFQVKAFSQIYKLLTSEHSPAWWAQKYRDSAAFAQSMRGLKPQERVTHSPHLSRRWSVARRTPPVRQLGVLIRRYIDLITRDHRNLLMLFLQAPAIALLMKMGFKHTSFDTTPPPEGFLQPPHGDGQSAVMIIFFLALVAIWLGIFDATREIVKEQAIYRRERMATVDAGPYLLSKVIVLTLIGAIQVFSLLAVAALVIEFPIDEWVDYVTPLATLLLGNLLGIGMGLLVSSVVSQPDKANTAMLFLVVPQMLLAGAFITIRDMDATAKFLSLFAAARWVFETLGAQMDVLTILDKQKGISTFLRESYLDTFSIDISAHLLIMGAAVLLLLVGCYISLRSKDPL